jgi:hypothetical protein
MKREIADSWNSGPERGETKIAFCIPPNDLKIYRELFWNI